MKYTIYYKGDKVKLFNDDYNYVINMVRITEIRLLITLIETSDSNTCCHSINKVHLARQRFSMTKSVRSCAGCI